MTRTLKKTRRIGRYHLLDRVAGGGMAEVFRGRLVEADGTEKLVALKQLLASYARDPTFVRMLIAEYQLAALLVHPNIAELYEFLRQDDAYFIAMEYVDGKDLRATLNRANQLGVAIDPADVAYILARALDGLHFAHTIVGPDGEPLELVHRDFSPSNVLVSYGGAVKIVDFGVAKARVPREQTANGIIKGKVRYMSPEQANGDPALTCQSDVFSAGSVLYEMLAGTPAFHANGDLEMIYTVRKAQPTPLRTVAPQVPEPLADIVEAAMKRLPGERLPDAGVFRDALVTFLRAYAPGYRRARVSNLMRRLWANEIELEIETLLEFALSEEPPAPAEDLLSGSVPAHSRTTLPDPDPDGVPDERPTDPEPRRRRR